MIKYALPGLIEHHNLNFFILQLKLNNPEFFYDNIEIEVCYGNPQFCIWDGGRVFSNYIQNSSEEVEHIINIYNDIYNIKTRYVFTNQILKEEDYYNRYCNILMNIINKNNNKINNNEVVVADNNFLNYLKSEYKNVNFISSTTKCLNTPELALEELNNSDFSLVCLDYNLNNNLKFLKSLSDEQKEKTELLINAICYPGCPERKNHYYLNSVSHLNYGKKYNMSYCSMAEDQYNPLDKNSKFHLDYQKIKEIYEPLNFSHYKIEGRTWNDLDLLLTYCEYLIKPEYRNCVLSRAYQIICNSYGIF